MKLDIKSWRKVEKPNAQNISPKGRLQLRLSSPAPLYIEGREIDPETGEIVFEGEALIGFDSHFDIRSDMEMKFRIVGDVDVYVYDPEQVVIVFDDTTEIYTNVDKMPLVSEAVEAVQAAVRLFQLEQKYAARTMRAEREAIEARRLSLLALEQKVEPPPTENPVETE